MARIVGVHGIAQQLRGPELLRAEWAPAVRDGITLSGAKLPPKLILTWPSMVTYSGSTAVRPRRAALYGG